MGKLINRIILRLNLKGKGFVFMACVCFHMKYLDLYCEITAICRKTIKCTLFGSYVDSLNAFLSSGNGDNAVVVLHMAKVNIFNGIVSIYFIFYKSVFHDIVYIIFMLLLSFLNSQVRSTCRMHTTPQNFCSILIFRRQ